MKIPNDGFYFLYNIEIGYRLRLRMEKKTKARFSIICTKENEFTTKNHPAGSTQEVLHVVPGLTGSRPRTPPLPGQAPFCEVGQRLGD